MPEARARAAAPPSRAAIRFFQHVLGGIHEAGVDVAEFFQREEIGRVLGAVEYIGELVRWMGTPRDLVVGSGCWPACRQRVSNLYSSGMISSLSGNDRLMKVVKVDTMWHIDASISLP